MDKNTYIFFGKNVDVRGPVAKYGQHLSNAYFVSILCMQMGFHSRRE